MGMMAISLGLGTIFPSINSVAQPLVCPDGEMSSQKSFTNPRQRPGETVIQASWTCVDSSGSKKPINKFLLTLYAGSFYGVLMFVFFWIISRLRRGSGN